MDYKFSSLPNGLRVLTIPMPALESATATIWVRTGSRNEDEKVNGISHFLEHMAFKGSSKRPEAKDIAEAVDNIGGEFNAATSKEWTNFYIRSRSVTLDTAIDVLSDMTLRPILRQEDIDREKGVILEEIAMHEDTPMRDIGDVFERLVFKGSDLGRDIIGTKETVKAINKADFEQYRQEHYSADNMLLVVAGGVKEDQVLKIAEKYLGELPTNSAKTKQNPVSFNQISPEVYLKSKQSEQAHFIYGFRGYGRGNPNRFAEALLATILGGSMSSRLFTEIREKRGLAYAVAADADHYIDTGSFSIYAGVVLDKTEEAIKVTHEQCFGLADGSLPITKEELARAKEFVRGHLALSLESTKSVGYFFGEKELMQGKVDTPDEIFEKIAEVSAEDILEVAKDLFKPEKLNLTLIGPFEDAVAFEKIIK